MGDNAAHRQRVQLVLHRRPHPLVEAAQTAVRFDPELPRDYQRSKFRCGASVAKIMALTHWVSTS